MPGTGPTKAKCPASPYAGWCSLATLRPTNSPRKEILRDRTFEIASVWRREAAVTVRSRCRQDCRQDCRHCER